MPEVRWRKPVLLEGLTACLLKNERASYFSVAQDKGVTPASVAKASPNRASSRRE